MTADRWTLIERLFTEAAALAPEAREAFLEQACRTADGAPDAALREEVERLLAYDARADGFFDTFAGGGLLAPAPPRAPTRVGPWRIVEKVGEGGMGEVFLAERDQPFRQRAAVKLVRPGLGADLLARFRAERHVLARLEHPAIARLLDGGTAPDGRPYLALEYVDGEPITAYCDRRRLGVNERLVLFSEVCEAVAAAHRQLVVHRDLKPSNVLVTDEGQVKLLDFGIAKLLDDAPSFTVAVTRADQRVMTPEYAAPETVRGEPAATTTDVYGLGVLLYELLTGRRPYQVPQRVRRAIEQAILEEEPTEPSTAVTGAETAGEEASARGLTPDRLRRRLRGDLDRIVLKALRKEPDRRYGSAESLAADVGRHLEGVPVEARPASLGYRVGRFVRRHRVGVGVALAAVALGAAYLATTVVQARRIAQERDRAEAVTDLLVGLFDGGDPAIAQGDTLTALALLDSAAARLDTTLADQPALRADLQLALGRIYLQQGAFGRADSLLTPALGWRRRSASPLALVDALTAAASADYWLGRYEEGEAKHREALDIEAGRYKAPHPALAARLNHLGIARTRLGDYAGARGLHEQALGQYRQLGADLEIGRSLRRLAILDFYAEDHAQADTHFREARALLTAALGQGHPDVVMTRREHAWAIGGLGRPEEAVAMLQAVHRDNLRLYGEGHPTVPNTLGEMSRYQREAGDLDGAEASAREGLRIIRQIYGADHQYAANNALNLATVLRERGRYAEARAMAEEALAIHRATLGPQHPFTGASLGHVARLAALQGDRAAAIRFEREALSVLEAGYGPDHARTDTSRARLARLLASG